jgi:hypothetical protein
MVDVVTTSPAVASAKGDGSYVEWSAVFAGAVAASAISFVLLTAGTAIGLSLLSPDPAHSYGKAAGSLAAFWALAVPILAFLIGGYIAGRMRGGWDGADADEVQFRDGIHGLLVWAVSIVIGGIIAALAATSAAHIGIEAGKAALPDRGTIVAAAVDTMFRPQVAAAQVQTSPERSPGAPTGATSPARPAASPSTPAEARSEIARALTAAVSDGKLNGSEKAYLAQIVSAQTGLPPADAEKRVDEAYAQAVSAVDKARKASVVAALATATALLLGLAAAWYAAQHGGRHRDNNIPAKFTFLRRSAVRSVGGAGPP